MEQPDLSKMSLEELFEEFKKLPDWNLYPMPEVFYKHFNVRKPQPADIEEIAHYNPPAHLPLGDGKVEIREPAPGGVRQIELPALLPVETLVIKDEEEEKPKQLTNQSDDEKKQD